MRRLLLFNFLLCSLLLSIQTARADDDPNTIVFQETFYKTDGKGGRDGLYSGSNIASSTIKYDNEGWADAVKSQGAYQCVKFGTANDDGVLTTPAISLGGATHVLLTFSAAGWGDNKKNTLAITAPEGFTLSGDTEITELVNEEWKDYAVLITANSTSANLQLTFTGKRGFLDDVVVRTITTVPAPTLSDSFTFWPETTEEKASRTVTLTPVSYTTTFYTTNGSTPSKTNGKEALLTTGIAIQGTTTVKAISYVGEMASEMVERTYTQGNTVNSIGNFKQLGNGTEVRLYLSADANARVLHGHDNKMYLRDNSGTLCLDFGTTATFNPAPAHNQHVAGWIIGEKQTVNGLTKLVATSNTTTDFLALAAPVTEADTEPVVVTPDDGGVFDFSSHAGNWVTVSEAYVSDDLAIENTFNTENVANEFYYNQLVDASAIVISQANGKTTLAPVAYNDIKPIVYVINEDKNYGGPATDIPHATVRLKRTLSKDYWNTLVVPFEFSNFQGEICVYSDLIDGNTMHFSKTDQIEAGQPYLVKPNEDIIDPVFDDVKLSATQAASVNKGGDYEFVGTYSPVELATDKTELFLTTTGSLAWPQDDSSNRLKGLRAYFQVPSGGAAPALVVDGSPITGIDGTESLTTDQVTVFDLSGRKIYSGSFADCKLPRGVYIVNGKKLIIH